MFPIRARFFCISVIVILSDDDARVVMEAVSIEKDAPISRRGFNWLPSHVILLSPHKKQWSDNSAGYESGTDGEQQGDKEVSHNGVKNPPLPDVSEKNGFH